MKWKWKYCGTDNSLYHKRIKGIVEAREKRKNIHKSPEEEELGKGNLFATGLVAGGAVAGVLIAFISGSDGGKKFLDSVNTEHGLMSSLGENGYFILGVLFFAIMAGILYKIAVGQKKGI